MPVVKYTRHKTEFSVDTATLIESARDYLWQYGWSQSLQDSVAGTAKAVWEELAERAMKEVGLVAADKTRPFAEFVAYMKLPEASEFAKTFDELVAQETVKTELANIQKRVTAILEGKVGSRAGGSNDPVDVEIRRLGRIGLATFAKAQDMKLPKDREVYNEMLDAFVAKNDKALRSAAESNLKNLAKMANLVG